MEKITQPFNISPLLPSPGEGMPDATLYVAGTVGFYPEAIARINNGDDPKEIDRWLKDSAQDSDAKAIEVTLTEASIELEGNPFAKFLKEMAVNVPELTQLTRHSLTTHQLDMLQEKSVWIKQVEVPIMRQAGLDDKGLVVLYGEEVLK